MLVISDFARVELEAELVVKMIANLFLLFLLASFFEILQNWEFLLLNHNNRDHL